MYKEIRAAAELMAMLKEGKEKSGSAVYDDVAGSNVPESVTAITAKPYELHGKSFTPRHEVLDAILDGAEEYKRRHGREAPADVIATGLHNAAMVANRDYAKQYLGNGGVFDDASSDASGAAMQSNRAVIAAQQTIADATPFAGYIPMDKGMQGKIIVVNHTCGSNTGSYNLGDAVDGSLTGERFMSTERRVVSADAASAEIKNHASDAAGCPVIPTSGVVYVNGLPVGRTPITGVPNSQVSVPINGSFTLAGVAYTISGTLTPETGTFAFSFAPALPTGATVSCEAHVNFEHATMKGKRAQFAVTAADYNFRAHFMSGFYTVTKEAQAQFNAEVGIDPGTEAMYQLRVQSSSERHRQAVKAMYEIAANNVTTFDMDYQNKYQQRSINDMWQDVIFPIQAAHQAMISNTQNFGIGCIYVNDSGKSLLETLNPMVFEPAGMQNAIPGIYRIGRLCGTFDVYYIPRLLQQTPTAIEMLCIGRASQVARNPMIFGDVAGPQIFQIPSRVDDIAEGYGYFQAQASIVNPYLPSAIGAALIQITNVK